MTLNELRERFLETGFCPSRIRDDMPVYYTRLHVESEPPSGGSYGSNEMYNVLCHMDGRETKADRPFADWTTKAEAEFIRDVVEWFRKDSGEEQ